MTVIFDMFLFNERYIDEIRKKEEQENHHHDEEAEFELGAISCRNTGREMPIFFYDVAELGELLEAGYAVGRGQEARLERLGTDIFPADTIIPTLIELDKPVVGRFIDPDGQEAKFSTRKELADIVGAQLPHRQNG